MTAENFTVKICVETAIGELLAVQSFEVPDDLLTAGDVTRYQDKFLRDLQQAGMAAYREAAGK